LKRIAEKLRIELPSHWYILQWTLKKTSKCKRSWILMKLYLLSMYKNLQILATLGSSSWISSAACKIASIMVVRASEGGTAPAMPLDVLSWPWPSSRFNVAPTNLSQLLVTRDIVYNNDIWRIKSWCRGFWSLTCEMFFF